MHMGHENPARCYTLNGETIQAVDEEEDLGVYLSSDCKTKPSVHQGRRKSNAEPQNHQEDLQLH